MSEPDVLRLSGRVSWSAAVTLVVAGLSLAPAMAWAQGAGGDPGKTPEREQKVEEAPQGDVDWEDKPYTVVDGQVDQGTYNGYRRYHSHCHVCHGPDALGSSYAPALIDSIPRIGYQGYVEAVVYGIQNVNQAQQLVMPAFGEVADVINNIDDIYAYLKARADGVIGRGRPGRLPK